MTNITKLIKQLLDNKFKNTLNLKNTLNMQRP